MPGWSPQSTAHVDAVSEQDVGMGWCSSTAASDGQPPAKAQQGNTSSPQLWSCYFLTPVNLHSCLVRDGKKQLRGFLVKKSF